MGFGLCLAGGGVKGAAHIGVLKALEEENIKIDYIGGTSSGSIVSTLIAVGYNADEIYDIFKKYAKKIGYVDFKNIMKLIYGLVLKRRIIIEGFNSGMQLENLVNQVCNEKGVYNISDIKMPLVIPTVDLANGSLMCFTSQSKKRNFSDEIIYINNIPIGKAVQSSCSYPIVFAPSKYKNFEFVDGGIRENVPWKEVRALGADKILSVTFNDELKNNCCSNFIEVADRSFSFLCRELSNYEMEGADCVLKIDCGKVGLLDMKVINKLYELGYQTAKKNMKTIKEKLD